MKNKIFKNLCNDPLNSTSIINVRHKKINFLCVGHFTKLSMRVEQKEKAKLEKIIIIKGGGTLIFILVEFPETFRCRGSGTYKCKQRLLKIYF